MEDKKPEEGLKDHEVAPRWCGYCGNYIKSDMTKFLAHLKDCEAASSQYYGRQKRDKK